jgi:Cu(I)/Ag(I) efflux system membrane protein CusA/SilA
VILDEVIQEAMPRFDTLMSEYCYHRNREATLELGFALAQEAVDSWIRREEVEGRLLRQADAADREAILSQIGQVQRLRLGGGPTLEDAALIVRIADRISRERMLASPVSSESRSKQDIFYQAGDNLGLSPAATAASRGARLQKKLAASHRRLWREHVSTLNMELSDRGPAAIAQVLVEALLVRLNITDAGFREAMTDRHRLRSNSSRTGAGHHGASASIPFVEPRPRFDALLQELSTVFKSGTHLARKERSDLVGPGGDLDRALQMPGWTNVWTMPIQNRVDMLTTGVTTTIGIRVLGNDLDHVVETSEHVAEAVKAIPGAANVVADPIRGKGYLEVVVDRERAAEWGLSATDINDVVETALAGKTVDTITAGRERYPITIRYSRDVRADEESLSGLLIPLPPRRGENPADERTKDVYVALADVADIRVTEAPATIKSDNGELRNYVRLNVRGRNLRDFLAEAQRATAGLVLPTGTHLEWTGRFEHEIQAAQTLALWGPAVVLVIFGILYFTYRDWADAGLLLTAVPGALAGGVFFQWLFGFPFSVTVWVGYLACFGMAVSTGAIMLVYLREAVAHGGGIEHMTLAQLREAVLRGAVHRLRPKLLTEGTTILGLAPMLWATGVGSEVIRPMAAPVLGGILIADEAIDLFLPVAFYYVRARRWRRIHDPAVPSPTHQSTTAELESDPKMNPAGAAVP